MAKFRAGESGNPGGRPAGHGEIREIARKHTNPAIETLAAIMNDASASPSARVGAATALLDRAWGRPEQSIRASVDSNASMLDDALEKAAGDLLDKIKLGKSSEQAASSDCAAAIPTVAV